MQLKKILILSPEFNSAAGRLFHSSTILTEKNIYVYPNVCILSSRPLSSVHPIVTNHHSGT